MAGLLGFTLADLSGAVDSRKRQYANLVRGLLSDPGATLAQLAAVDAEAARGNRYTQMSAGSVMPEVAQQGQEAMLNAALNVGGLLGMTSHAKSLKAAQRNAAKPVEKGGLGLPKDNTAADRAAAMGFDTKGYRGSSVDEATAKGPRWWSEHPDYASAYASLMESPRPDSYAGNVMPLLINKGKAKKFDKYSFGGVPDTQEIFKGFENGVATGYRIDHEGKILEGLTVPQNVRSRFAAFDPAKRNSTDLLATLAAMGLFGGGYSIGGNDE